MCGREAIAKGISPEKSSYLSTSSQRSPAELGFLSVPFVCAASAVRCVLCSEGGCSMCTIARQGALCGWEELRCDAMHCDAANETTEQKQSRAAPQSFGHSAVDVFWKTPFSSLFTTITNQPPHPSSLHRPPELIFQPPRVGCQSNPIPPTFRLRVRHQKKTRSSATSSAQTGCIEITQPQGL